MTPAGENQKLDQAWLAQQLQGLFRRESAAEAPASARTISQRIAVFVAELAHFDADDDEVLECEREMEALLINDTFATLSITNKALIAWSKKTIYVLANLEGLDGAEDALNRKCNMSTIFGRERFLTGSLPIKDLEKIIHRTLNFRFAGHQKYEILRKIEYDFGRHIRACEKRAFSEIALEAKKMQGGVMLPQIRSALPRELEYITKQLDLIADDASYRSDDGLYEFENSGQKLTRKPPSQTSQFAGGFYLELLRITDRIIQRNIHSALGNVDDELPYLFLEYQRCLREVINETNLLISIIRVGAEIEQRIRHSLSIDQGSIDRGRMITFESFFISHKLFISSFDQLERVMNPETRLDWSESSDGKKSAILQAFSKSLVFDEATSDFLKRVSGRSSGVRGAQSKTSAQIEDVATGVLRGSLKQMTSTAIRKVRDTIETTDEDEILESVGSNVVSDKLISAICDLVLSEKGDLYHLSREIPQLFQYIQNFIPFIEEYLQVSDDRDKPAPP